MRLAGLCTGIGVVGGAIAAACGGWDELMVALCFCMLADFVMGILVAIRGKSKKTKSGALNSTVGLKGICKKVAMLLIVVATYRIGIAAGIPFVRDAVIFAFIANEAISLLENGGLLGVIKPSALTQAIDILKSKSDDK